MRDRRLIGARVVIRRRHFLACAAGATLACLSRTAAARAAPEARWFTTPDFDRWVDSRMETLRIPGLALAVIDDGEILRTASYGWADIAQRRPMQTHSLLNIASVTKTITATAVMQLSERGKLALDDDLNRYLPFPVRNPRHDAATPTARQLLTHTSSIADGPAYDASYACGDPQIPLGEWLRHYFCADGRAWDPQRNFHPWAPGEQRRYSNVAYGLLGYLVEVLSGLPYAHYCTRRIFVPLGMSHSRYLIAGLRREAHATPYTYIYESDRPAVQLTESGWTTPAGKKGIHVPHCLYSFATPPDGLARTSAIELARLLMAMMNRGELDGQRILAPETALAMLCDQRVVAKSAGKVVEPVQGLAWMGRRDLGRETVWSHSGDDPGVSAIVALRRSDRRGVVVLVNADGAGSLGEEIVSRAFAS